MLIKLLNLQLFGEGGDGGDGGATSDAGESLGESGENKELASIPEKAKKYYRQPKATATDEPKAKVEKTSYADLIKSDEYKEEHKAYMDKTISERLKKYKGIEDELGKTKAMLDVVAQKYGVSPEDANYMEVLGQKINADDSYYENYAMEHDLSTDEARRIVTMEREFASIQRQKDEAQRKAQVDEQIRLLTQNAEKTKAMYDGFDLETEMQDERFQKLCAVTNGDTTTAYIACHWGEILPATVSLASKQIRSQTAKAIASNSNRPVENGLSNVASSTSDINFRNMDLKSIRAYAEQQRRLGR